MFMPRILEATTVLAGFDEYSPLKGVQIRLVGKMKPAFTRGEGFARQDSEGVFGFDQRKAREFDIVKYDVSLEAPPGISKVIFCLCMLPRAESYDDSVELALVPTGRKDEDRRVGLVFNIQLSWHEICAEEEIMIV